MFVAAPTNPEENFMRYVRASDKFQEYLSGVWTDKVLALAGGGTGGSSASAARTSLGLGSMALQNSNAIAVTGGSVSSGVAIDAAALTSGLVAQARLGSGSGGAGLKFLADDQTFKVPVTLPVGVCFIWFTPAAPSGYLICDGSAVSRATYSALFVVVGTAYGAGDGSTTFNLPNLSVRFPLGLGAPPWNTVAGFGGAIDHNHTSAAHLHAAGTLAGPSHTHAAGSFAAANHTHSFSATSGTAGGGNGVTSGSDFTATLTSHTHSVSGTTGAQNAAVTGTSAADGTQAVTGSTASTTPGPTGSNNPPYLLVSFIVKY